MLSYKIHNIKQSYVLYSTYTRYNLLFKYKVWYLCMEECVLPSSTYSPLPWYTDFWLHIIPWIQKLSTTLGASSYFQVPGESYEASSRPQISGATVRNWVIQDLCMADFYYYCSLIVILYYHSLLQFFFIAYSLSTDSLFVTSKIHIISAFINPGLQAIIHALYVATIISPSLSHFTIQVLMVH